MKKLTVIFIALIVMVNCFSLSYIMISTHFINDNIIKDIAWEVLDEDEKQYLSVPWNDIKVKLVKIGDEKRLTDSNEKYGFDYDITILNGGYLVKVPITFEKNNKKTGYAIYVNPFTKRVASVTE